MYILKSTANAPTDSIVDELGHLPPDNNKAVCMSVKFLNKRSQADRIRIVGALPPSVTELDLSVNYLAGLTGAEFAYLVAAVPPGVEKLELFGNYLFLYKTCDDIVTAVKNLPAGIKTLGLGYNNLVSQTPDSWDKIFHALPGHITSLDLKGSNLFEQDLDVIKKLLTSMPLHIHFIDLSENGLDDLSEDALDAIMSVIPASTSVRTGYRPDGAALDIEGRKAILPSLIEARGADAIRRLQQLRTGATLPDARLPDVSSTQSRREMPLPGITSASGTKLPQPPSSRSGFFPPVSPLAARAGTISRGGRTAEKEKSGVTTPAYRSRWF